MALGTSPSPIADEILELWCKFNLDSMEPNSSIKRHFFSKIELGLKLSNCGEPVDPSSLLSAISKTVSPEWKSWVDELFLLNAPNNLEECFDILIDHEQYILKPTASNDYEDSDEPVLETQSDKEAYEEITKSDEEICDEITKSDEEICD